MANGAAMSLYFFMNLLFNGTLDRIHQLFDKIIYIFCFFVFVLISLKKVDNRRHEVLSYEWQYYGITSIAFNSFKSKFPDDFNWFIIFMLLFEWELQMKDFPTWIKKTCSLHVVHTLSLHQIMSHINKNYNLREDAYIRHSCGKIHLFCPL